MPFLELTAAHPATQKRGRGLLRLAVVVEERNLASPRVTLAARNKSANPVQPSRSPLDTRLHRDHPLGERRINHNPHKSLA